MCMPSPKFAGQASNRKGFPKSRPQGQVGVAEGTPAQAGKPLKTQRGSRCLLLVSSATIMATLVIESIMITVVITTVGIVISIIVLIVAIVVFGSTGRLGVSLHWVPKSNEAFENYFLD